MHAEVAVFLDPWSCPPQSCYGMVKPMVPSWFAENRGL